MLRNLALTFTLLFACFSLFAQDFSDKKREFRGVWVATVENIDWPSQPNLPTEMQKQELIAILDQHKQTGINALIFQVRPAADAFYGKGRENWSYFLTGAQGKAPDPYYDPLQFAIEEAHKRGMELHAWFNPYRGTTSLNQSKISPNHISNTRPEWFFTYGGKKYFNPGIPEVRDYIIQVVMDVVRNYDIDGVHFDDYFYPDKIHGQPLPDTATFRLYNSNLLNIDDWRRQNVDTLIHAVSDSVHHAKKYLKFGISPFGIWKNKRQDTLGSETNGGSSYLELYADSRKWLQMGWVDYITPQMYWALSSRVVPFAKLLNWWSLNLFGRHLYVGQAAYRAAEKGAAYQRKNEIPNEIRLLRTNPRVQGSIFFSSKSLRRNFATLNDSLSNTFYKIPALPPVMIWRDSISPNPPRELIVKKINNSNQLSWQAPTQAADGDFAYGYVVYRITKGQKVNADDVKNIIFTTYDANITSFTDENAFLAGECIYVVTALDRMKNESAVSNVGDGSGVAQLAPASGEK